MTGVLGESGLMGSHYGDGVDGCRVGDLDLDLMRVKKIEQRQKGWRESVKKVQEKFPVETSEHLLEVWKDYVHARDRLFALWEKAGEGKGSFRDWIDARAKDTVPDALYVKGEVAQLLIRDGDWHGGMPTDVADLQAWMDSTPPFTCWGIVMDGKWYEKGAMGWWGMSSGDISENEWQTKCADLFGELSPDKWVTVVDCHT